MLKHEIAEIVNSVDMYELAHKTVKGLALGDAETEAQKQLDQWAKYVGSTGHDPNREIAAFVERVVNDEIVQPPESILDYAFDRGMIGEFDAYEAYGAPKNTLIAYEAAPGGNVPRSFLDLSATEPKYVNLQVETDLDYADLRRNGWKTVARLTEYAVNALRFKQIAAVMSGIDALITSGADNYIAETGSAPSAASVNALALYLLDRGSGHIVAASKYAQAISKLQGFDSDSMLDEINRTGYLGWYDGNQLHAIPATMKTGDGTFVLPDKRVFGFAGKVGSLDMRGDVHVYENMDNNNECLHLLVKDFSFVYVITNVENVAKIVMAQ